MTYLTYQKMFYDLFILQKHDIIKKRLDTHGNVIEERQDGIGGPKVRNAVFLEVHLLPLVFTLFFSRNSFTFLWIELSFTFGPSYL